MSTLRITVTQDDIDQGIQCDCFRCPVALAVARALNLPTTTAQVKVTRYGVTVYDDEWDRLDWSASRRFAQFISDVDEGKQVRPITFILQSDRG